MRLSGIALDMLAQQSTGVLKSVIKTYLNDYLEIARTTMPEGSLRVVDSVVGHQMELLEEIPPAALGDLFLRAKTQQASDQAETKADDELTKTLLETD